MKTRILCLLLALLFLTGCTKEPPVETVQTQPAETAQAEPDSNWVILCPKDAPAALEQAARSLQTTLKNKHALDLKIVTQMPDTGKVISVSLEESLSANSYRTRVTEQGIFFEMQNANIVPLALRQIRENWLVGRESLKLTQTDCAALSGTVETASAPFLLLTQNIRYADDPNGNSVIQRAPRFRQLVSEYLPDIICLQEDNRTWSEILDSFFLNNYGVAGGYSGGPDSTTGNRQAIFFRTERYELVESGCVWLSQTPDVPMSKLSGSNSVRTCTWAILRDTFAGSTLLVCNMHLDTASDSLRSQQLQILFTELGDLMAQHPTLLCGDMNATPDSTTYANATQNLSDPHETAAQKVIGDGHTYTNYDQAQDPRRLDYMLFSEGITAQAYRILTEQYEGYISDHFGACTQFAFEKK